MTMKYRKLNVLLLLIVGLLPCAVGPPREATGGQLLRTRAASDYAEPGNQPPTDSAATVDGTTPEPLTADERASQRGYVGVILPREVVEITSTLQLPIKAIHVDLDDELEGGTVIAELDTTSIDKALEIAEVSLDLAANEAKAAEERARAARELHEVVTGLFEGDNATPKEYLQSELEMTVTEFGKESAVGRIKQYEASVEQLRHELATARLCAPFRGIVAARYGSPGDLAGPSTPIARFISRDSFVRFAVEPEHAVHLKRGDPVAVEVPILSLSLRASVEHISPEVDAASGRVVIEAGLKGTTVRSRSLRRKQRSIKPGMVVRVHLTADKNGSNGTAGA